MSFASQLHEEYFLSRYRLMTAYFANCKKIMDRRNVAHRFSRNVYRRSCSMDFKLKGSESVPMEHDESNDTHTNVQLHRDTSSTGSTCADLLELLAHAISPHNHAFTTSVLLSSVWTEEKRKKTTIYITDMLWARNIYNNICNCKPLVPLCYFITDIPDS